MAGPPVLACPHCRGHVSQDPRLANRVVSCPHCRGQFQMPSVVPPARPPVQQDSSSPFADLLEQRTPHDTAPVPRRRPTVSKWVFLLPFLGLTGACAAVAMIPVFLEAVKASRGEQHSLGAALAAAAFTTLVGAAFGAGMGWWRHVQEMQHQQDLRQGQRYYEQIAQCPSCGALGASQVIGTQEVSTGRVEYADEVRYIHHRDAAGNVFHTEERLERVPREVKQFLWAYRCGGCNHTWTINVGERTRQVLP